MRDQDISVGRHTPGLAGLAGTWGPGGWGIRDYGKSLGGQSLNELQLALI